MKNHNQCFIYKITNDDKSLHKIIYKEGYMLMYPVGITKKFTSND